jgi:hypothetical protein
LSRCAIAVLGILAACGGRETTATPASTPPLAPAHPPTPAAAPAPPPPLAEPIQWAIFVEPATVTMAQRASVMVTIQATNTNVSARDPERDPLDFTVDGAPSQELSMAFGNGGREAAWSLIPPGHSAIDERTGMTIVAAPGDHVLAIAHGGHELARTTLHVSAH